MDQIQYSYEQKDELLKKSEISIWLSSYEDIFSDFDPRSYKERAISQDFLEEIKRASKDKDEKHIELNFLVSKEKRDTNHELMIIKRLKEHFKRHAQLLVEERKNMVKKGLFFVIIGVLLMLFATSMLFFLETQTFLSSFLIVLFEPGGWFFFWEGAYMIVFEGKSEKEEREFYKKMTRCNIFFINY